MIEPIFSKADLKTMDIVKYRDGTYNMVLANPISLDGLGMYVITGSGISDCNGYLSNFKDDLTYPSMENRDIVAVYGKPLGLDMPNLREYFLKGIDPKHPYLPPLIWKRKEEPKVKEITADEAAKLLKEKFPGFNEVKILV